ncbi:MAG: hypothetical protein DMG35_20620 [Acidobacteria bacterium]|nr:MAG: hypothetical protein DMG35_20620 [Acidobacteriota bacterium]
MPQAGFLGTAVTWSADVTLLLEIGMGMGLLAGASLARAKCYRAHAVCQSMIVLLNVGLIAMTMIPSLRHQVIPKLPRKIAKPYYAFATAHATLGGIAELGGLYILLSAGTKWLPEKIRITRYKFWMRGVLILWWLVLLLGIATYWHWNVPRS